MAKVGRFVTDPKAGALCHISFDGGEKIVVNHDKGGFKGGHLRIEQTKWMGFGSDRVFECDLDSPAGKAAMARLTKGVAADSALATPLGAFVEYVKSCASIADVKTKCATLMSGR